MIARADVNDESRVIAIGLMLRDFGTYYPESLGAELGITPKAAARLARRLAAEGKLPRMTHGGKTAGVKVESAFASSGAWVPVGQLLISAALTRARLDIESDPRDPRHAPPPEDAPAPLPLSPLDEWRAGINPLIGRRDTAVSIFDFPELRPKHARNPDDASTRD